MYTPLTKKEREAEERKKSLNQLKTLDCNLGNNQISPTNVSSGNSDKEKSPLLPKDISISIGKYSN